MSVTWQALATAADTVPHSSLSFSQEPWDLLWWDLFSHFTGGETEAQGGRDLLKVPHWKVEWLQCVLQPLEIWVSPPPDRGPSVLDSPSRVTEVAQTPKASILLHRNVKKVAHLSLLQSPAPKRFASTQIQRPLLEALDATPPLPSPCAQG